MSEFQERVCAAIRRLPGQTGTLDAIAVVVGSNRVAVYSALNSLRHQGAAHYFRSGNGGRWDVQIWGVEPQKACTEDRRAAPAEEEPHE